MSRLALFGSLSIALSTMASAITPQSPEKVLAGRVAGPPTDCIDGYERDRGGQLYADGSILYYGRGSTVYLNHPAGCPAFRSDLAITSRTPSDRLCRGDIIQVIQPSSGIFAGTCALSAFTPYPRDRATGK